jgi:hypothetical protein
MHGLGIVSNLLDPLMNLTHDNIRHMAMSKECGRFRFKITQTNLLTRTMLLCPRRASRRLPILDAQP